MKIFFLPHLNRPDLTAPIAHQHVAPRIRLTHKAAHAIDKDHKKYFLSLSVKFYSGRLTRESESMSTNSIEQRKYKRLYFPTHEMIRAVFSFSGDKQLMFESKVLNLSELGLGLVVRKSDTNAADDLKAGDVLHLKEIVGSPDLKFVRELKSEIRWVANAQWMDNIGFGCEYIDISPELREKLNSFISVAEETMDNYFVSLDDIDTQKMG